MLIGTYIWQRRMELGISQKDLAASVGISATYLSDIERGNRAVTQPEMIERLANALLMASDILYFHAGLLAPDMYAIPFPEDRICCEYSAMRRCLMKNPRRQ